MGKLFYDFFGNKNEIIKMMNVEVVDWEEKIE